jgi:predicted transcriptional regulator
MKTFEIKIKSIEESDRDVIQAFKDAQAGRKATPKKGVYFTSLEAVKNLLTEKRFQLLHMIKEKHPKSISELARLSERNFKNVYADLQTLKNYGLIQMRKSKGKSKRINRASSQNISVPYQAINIHAGI